MPKYDCDMGDPIDMLAEECAEVIQMCMKIKRFYNADGTHKLLNYTGIPARDKLVQEIGDLLVVIDIVQDKSSLRIGLKEIAEAKQRKIKRLEELFGFHN